MHCYQKTYTFLGAVSTQGLHWLATLHDKEFNGILADEILGFWRVESNPRYGPLEVWRFLLETIILRGDLLVLGSVFFVVNLFLTTLK